MPDSNLKCINSGGEQSRLRLPLLPALEQEISGGSRLTSALRCWKARPGEIFTVCDPAENQYRARLTSLAEETATLHPFAAIAATDSPISLHICQALPAKERFELILQKLTELGVDQITPYLSRHSATLAELDAGQKKSHRWPEVLLRAARQCRRATLPCLTDVSCWAVALEACAAADLSLFCYEGTGGMPLARALDGFVGGSIALMIGPEGGFSTRELAEAKGQGILPVSLGPRMLRTETAAIFAAGAIQFALGDLGQQGAEG